MMIELIGDMGSGKTTLVQGMARGLGFTKEVPSPTFTLSRVYPVRDGLQLHHFDLYRLSGPDAATAELAEVQADPSAIVAIEWAGNAKVELPADRVRISLMPVAEREAERSITIEGLGERSAQLVKGLGA